MDPITALTIGSIVAGAGGNLAGGLSQARQLYSPELEDQVRRQQALRDEASRRFVQEARAGQAGQMLDVQQAAQQQAAAMGAQGGFSGREQMNTALALQEQRAAQQQALTAQQAQMQMQREMQQAQENAEIAQRKADARAARAQAVAGALGTAATQGLGVAQQSMAMNRQQSYFDAMIKGFSQQAGARQAQAQAASALEQGMVGALQPASATPSTVDYASLFLQGASQGAF